MARVPNYAYAGSSMPIGQGIANLGRALFGDPQEEQQLENQRLENEYRRASIDSLNQTMRTTQHKQDQQNSINAALLKALNISPDSLGASDAFAAPDATMMPPPDIGASQPDMSGGGIPNAPQAVAADASPIMRAPLPAPGAAPDVAPSLATSDLFTGDLPETYYRNLEQIESSGDPTVLTKEKDQTAGGLGGFTDKTWHSIGMQGRAVDAAPDVQRQGIQRLTELNHDLLQENLKRDNVTPGEVYAAHHLGADRALAFIRADPNTPVEQLLPEDVLKFNDHLRGKTAGQILQDWQAAVTGRSPMQPMQPTQINAAPTSSLVDAVTGGGAPQAAAVPGAQPAPMPMAPVPMAPGAQPAAADGAPGNPFENFIKDLTPNEKAAVVMDVMSGNNPLDTLQKIAIKKAGENDENLFGGTSVDAQTMNIINNVSDKIEKGIPLTSRERRAYAISWGRLTKERTFLDPQTGNWTSIPATDLASLGFIPPDQIGAVHPTGGGDATVTPQGGTMQTGYNAPTTQTTMAPNTGGQTVPPDMTQGGAGSTHMQVSPNKAVTVTQGPGIKIPGEQAGKAAATQAGNMDVDDLINKIVDPKTGNINRSVLYAMNITIPGTGQALPLAGGDTAQSDYLSSVQGIWRALTGAAMNPQEVPQFEAMFKPHYLNSDENVKRKLRRLSMWNQAMQQAMSQGRTFTDEELFNLSAQLARQVPDAPDNPQQGAQQPQQQPGVPLPQPGNAPAPNAGAPVVNYDFDPATGKLKMRAGQ